MHIVFDENIPNIYKDKVSNVIQNYKDNIIIEMSEIDKIKYINLSAFNIIKTSTINILNNVMIVSKFNNINYYSIIDPLGNLLLFLIGKDDTNLNIINNFFKDQIGLICLIGEHYFSCKNAIIPLFSYLPQYVNTFTHSFLLLHRILYFQKR